jgi:hypothetical protein
MTVTYQVRVKTGSMTGAGTDADVSIVLYGDKASSGPIPLDNDMDNFEAASEDLFTSRPMILATWIASRSVTMTRDWGPAGTWRRSPSTIRQPADHGPSWPTGGSPPTRGTARPAAR